MKRMLLWLKIKKIKTVILINKVKIYFLKASSRRSSIRQLKLVCAIVSLNCKNNEFIFNEAYLRRMLDNIFNRSNLRDEITSIDYRIPVIDKNKVVINIAYAPKNGDVVVKHLVFTRKEK